MFAHESTEFHAISCFSLKAIESRGPVEARLVNVTCSKATSSFRAHMSAAPLKRWCIPTQLGVELKNPSGAVTSLR